MGDHFWPAVYPGLVVGVLYGLSARGGLNAFLGALGGGLGAAVSLLVFEPFFLSDGLLPIGVLMAVSLGAAAGFVSAGRVVFAR
jgi:hypothetical protein